eukprot:2755784-Pleurochrysis_carterae.AAC.2
MGRSPPAGPRSHLTCNLGPTYFPGQLALWPHTPRLAIQATRPLPPPKMLTTQCMESWLIGLTRDGSTGSASSYEADWLGRSKL